MHMMHRRAAVVALAVLFCATVAHAGVFDDTDKRPKVLWLPVQNLDCPGTCRGVGLVAVTINAGDATRVACAAFPPKDDDDDIYMGTWRRLSTGNQCQAADNDDDAKARVFARSYYCACLPRKANGAMDAYWVNSPRPFSFRCQTGFSADPNLCLTTVNNVQYIGQRDDDDDECAYYVTGQVSGPRGRRTRTFSKLCVTSRFGYLAFDKYDKDD